MLLKVNKTMYNHTIDISNIKYGFFKWIPYFYIFFSKNHSNLKTLMVKYKSRNVNRRKNKCLEEGKVRKNKCRKS